MNQDKFQELSINAVKSACADALENIHAERNKMLTDYVREERQKREKWNAHWFVPRFLHRSLEAKVILDESMQGSLAQALHSAVFWAPMRGEECEKIVKTLMSVLARSQTEMIKVNVKDWREVCLWSEREKIQRFDFSQVNA